MSRGRHYPSQKKTNIPQVQQPINWQLPQENIQLEDIRPLTTFTDALAVKVGENFNEWKDRFNDEWENNVASINAHNSIAQYNEYILNRLSYVECSYLAIDTIINNAITKFANGCTNKGGEIIIDDKVDNPEEVLKKIEDRFEDLGGLKLINDLMQVALIYGTADLFIDVNTENEKLVDALIMKSEVFTQNKITNLQIVPPYTKGAISVETVNVLDKNYMKPNTWYIQGAGSVDSSRLISLTPFECPTLLKPIFNFGGVSLCQFMKNYVSTADSTRQSIADIILRFKTDIIQTDLLQTNMSEAIDRAKANNQTRNNLGMLLLTKDEVFTQINTPIAGLERISAHMMEYVSVSGRQPSTILFGTTPSGLNSTGEIELDIYYQELSSLQNSKIKPIIEQLLKMICLELGLDINPKWKFNELKKDNEVENVTVETGKIDNVIKMQDAGQITPEQGNTLLKDKGVIPDSMKYTEQEIDLDTPPVDGINGYENY